MEHRDVIVIGGGAAGLFCALAAGRRGRRVLVLEHNARPGMKILISGGGRCNFTNLRAGPENYLSACPDFCRSALARFTPQDFLDLVERHRIAWHEKKDGQLFCDGSSRQIVGLLVDECARARVEIRCSERVDEVSKQDKFRLRAAGEEFACDALVVATGGLSFPRLGASGFGHALARQFGLRVTQTRPGLVPLVFGGEDREIFGALGGLSLPVRARLGRAAFADDMLVTHRGLSGPAVLQISSYWREGEAVEFDLLPGGQGPPVPGRGGAAAQLAEVWPRRFAEAWCARHAPPAPVAQWTARQRADVAHLLRHWPVKFAGTEGYAKAEVTVGGVDTRELSSKTMEARKVPGLYFVGEVADVTGWLGGYNFQWAWASGAAAGEAA